MAIKARQIWVDGEGKESPDTDNRLYDVPCHDCGPMPCVGRVDGVFLCLGCIDERGEVAARLMENMTIQHGDIENWENE